MNEEDKKIIYLQDQLRKAEEEYDRRYNQYKKISSTIDHYTGKEKDCRLALSLGALLLAGDAAVIIGKCEKEVRRFSYAD